MYLKFQTTFYGKDYLSFRLEMRVKTYEAPDCCQILNEVAICLQTLAKIISVISDLQQAEELGDVFHTFRVSLLKP
jgi:hypothetical protein